MSVNPSDRYLSRSLSVLLYGLFFLSGISGLMYEVVWVRMLTRILGSTIFATSTVLAVFMAGLALGSFLIGRWADRFKNPLLWYAGLEIGIAVSAFLSFSLPNRLLPLYRMIYEWSDGSRAVLTLGQIAIATLVLLLPTALMGATLPTLCAFGGRRVKNFGRCVGTLYAVNTLGSVVGVLSAGFFFIGMIGESWTIVLGAVLNGLVSLAACLLALKFTASPEDLAVSEPEGRFAESPSRGSSVPQHNLYSKRVKHLVLFVFAVSGFVALANEVIWGRMLILYQGTSIYAFSSMLAVVLAGIGLGSLGMGHFVDRLRDPLRQLARVQLAIAVAALAGLHLFEWFGVFPATNLGTGSNLSQLLVAPMLMLGPLALLWGMTFPLSVRCYSSSLGSAGRDISELYAWNTVGSILGALAGGFCFMAYWGATASGTGLAVVSALAGVLLLSARPGSLRRSLPVIEGGLLCAGGLLFLTVGTPYFTVIEKRRAPVFRGQSNLYEHIEEAAGTITVFGVSSPTVYDRDKQLWVNGVGMTVLCTETKLMAHLPICLAENPRDVLVICLGMGTTIRSASRYQELNIQAVELLPGVIRCMQYFHADALEVLESPNVKAVVDDGRNYLLMRSQEYDVITVDPAPPLYSAGAVNLYTKEFFQLAKKRLRSGGIFCLWVPPDEKTEVSMIMRTFLEVFEHTSVWTGPKYKGLYLLGSRNPIENVEEKIRRFFGESRVVGDLPPGVKDLVEWDRLCDGPEKLINLHVADGDELRELFAGAPIVTDDHPYTEFPLLRVLQERNPSVLDGDALRLMLKKSQAAPTAEP